MGPKLKKGLTFIEALLYLAIVSFVSFSLVVFAWNVILVSEKNNTKQEIYSQARIVSERILFEIRNANDINFSDSNFDVDLVTNSNYKLSLATDAPNNPTLFYVNNLGILMIKQGSSQAFPLHSNSLKVKSLIFSNFSSADGKTKHIKYYLELEKGSVSSFAYRDLIIMEGSAEVRSNSL
jgi:hypothetical protein